MGARCGECAFSYVDKCGEVRFLLDGVENVGTAKVSFFFGLVDGACGSAEVHVAGAEALGLREGGILGLEVEILNGKAEICSAGGNSAEKEMAVALSSWSRERGGFRLVLSVTGLARSGCFAAGVELFVVRSDGVGEKMLVARALPLSVDEEIELFVFLGNPEPYAIIITTITFRKEGGIRGAKTVVVN